MNNRERAEAALGDMLQAIAAEVAAAGDTGLGNAEVACALGLESSVNGSQRNHLTHGLLSRLVGEGVLTRVERGNRVFYIRSTYVHNRT